MSDRPVRSVLIVGGGSAGWMTAAILSKLLPDVRVSLVESSDIPTIGVGEATIAHISKFFHLLGLKEADWMPPCNASYKYTIQYRNWHAMGDEYYHPFEPLIYHKSPFHLASFWWYDRYKRNPNKDRSTLYTDCFLSVDALKAMPHAEAMAALDATVDQLGERPGRVRVLDWDALRRLAEEGVEMGIHSRTHPLLDRLPADRLDEEIAGARDDLHAALGSAAAPAIAYPNGNHSAAVLAAVERAGLRVGFATARGTNDLGRPDWLALRRINVGMGTGQAALQAQLHGWLDRWT